MKGVMKAARPAVKAMKAMKAMKAIKLMKAMKAKKSKIASGKYRYNLVMWGRRTKTGGGLTKEDLMTGGKGKIVSRRKWELGKKRYGQISVWVECTKQARKELGLTGLVRACSGVGGAPDAQALQQYLLLRRRRRRASG